MTTSGATEIVRAIPVSAWISLFALLIAILSLYVSMRKLRYEKRLESARKRTELMNSLLDSKRNLETSLKYCKYARPVRTACQDKWQGHIPGLERTIEGIDESYADLQGVGHKVDPLKLEVLTPKIYKSLQNSESLQNGFKELLDSCASCPENTEIDGDDTKANDDAK
jgi:hypothetical protein